MLSSATGKLIQVIAVNFVRGDGTDKDPKRRVFSYYTPEGDFLAEDDPCLNHWNRPTDGRSDG